MSEIPADACDFKPRPPTPDEIVLNVMREPKGSRALDLAQKYGLTEYEVYRIRTAATNRFRALRAELRG